MSQRKFKESTYMRLPLRCRDDFSGVTLLTVSTVDLENYRSRIGYRYETLVLPSGKEVSDEHLWVAVDGARHKRKEDAMTYHHEMVMAIARGDVVLKYIE